MVPKPEFSAIDEQQQRAGGPQGEKTDTTQPGIPIQSECRVPTTSSPVGWWFDWVPGHPLWDHERRLVKGFAAEVAWVKGK